MAERATIQQVSQIGVETSPGTNVAAAIRLPATSIKLGINADVKSFRAEGTKYAGIAALGKEWVVGDIAGLACYSDLFYLLAGIMCKPESTQKGTTTAYAHEYELANAEPDDVATYSIEEGNPAAPGVGEVAAHECSYGLLTELGMAISRDSFDISGALIGRGFANLTTQMTAGTALDEVPILPGDISIYLDEDEGDLGDTLLERVLKTSFKLGDRFNPVWALNAAESSWAAHVERAPALTMTLQMAADATGMALLDVMRAGSTRFIRLEAVSSELAGEGIPYKLQLDMAGKVTGVSKFSDVDGVYASEWTFTGTPALTGDVPCRVSLTNKIASI